MIYGVYCIYDCLVGYCNPICELNDQVAMRNFESMFYRPDVSPVMHFRPQDFDLYKIGDFDSELGSFSPCDRYKVTSGSSLALSLKKARKSEESDS
ncbi:MAG: nonstructural protein [Microviridae sp.]|nr:MAG: nonstructural protein [Microviridae sp.]